MFGIVGIVSFVVLSCSGDAEAFLFSGVFVLMGIGVIRGNEDVALAPAELTQGSS